MPTMEKSVKMLVFPANTWDKNIINTISEMYSTATMIYVDKHEARQFVKTSTIIALQSPDAINVHFGPSKEIGEVILVRYLNNITEQDKEYLIQKKDIASIECFCRNSQLVDSLKKLNIHMKIHNYKHNVSINERVKEMLEYLELYKKYPSHTKYHSWHLYKLQNLHRYAAAEVEEINKVEKAVKKYDIVPPIDVQEALTSQKDPHHTEENDDEDEEEIYVTPTKRAKPAAESPPPVMTPPPPTNPVFDKFVTETIAHITEFGILPADWKMLWFHNCYTNPPKQDYQKTGFNKICVALDNVRWSLKYSHEKFEEIANKAIEQAVNTGYLTGPLRFWYEYYNNPMFMLLEQEPIIRKIESNLMTV
jgi:hypothetical protein